MYIKKYLKETNISDENKVEVIMNASAGVIYKIGDNGERMILLIKRSPTDHWPSHFEFPRGKCDKPIGEDKRQCCIREIKEETGLDVEIERFIDKFEYLADGGKRKTICYNYLCKIKNPEQKVKLSKEHSKYMWISQLGEAELLLLPDQVRTLEKVLSFNNKIISIPKNSFTKNNSIEEYLNYIFRF